MAKPGFKKPKPPKTPKKQRRREGWQEGRRKSDKLFKVLRERIERQNKKRRIEEE